MMKTILAVSMAFLFLVTFSDLSSAQRHCRKCRACGMEVATGSPDSPARTVEALKVPLKVDEESVSAGKALFTRRCSFCHHANNNETLVGPGLKAVLKNPSLPVSKKPATPENIANQLRRPFMNMPPFQDLSENDVTNIVAFLNTL